MPLPSRKRVQKKSGIGCGTVLAVLVALFLFGSCCAAIGALMMYELYREAQAESSLPTPPSGATPLPSTPSVPAPPPVSVPQPEQPRSERISAPRRPAWMGLSAHPTSQEMGFYAATAAIVPSLVSQGSTARSIVNFEEAERVYQARDRILARSFSDGLWSWPEVRQVISEIGTTVPLFESIPSLEPEGCLAFYQVVFGRMAFCASGIRRMTDTDLEGILVHEATHAALARMLLARSGYTPEELGAFVFYCGDVAEEFYFSTEALAFFNQTAYLSRRVQQTPVPSRLYETDGNIRAAREALLHPDRDARYYAQRIVWYMSQPSENPYRSNGGRRCGRLVAIRGAYQGQYVLSLDFSPQVSQLADQVPNFRYH
jgi:hypothetical protein